ncbi:MAG: low temperature requirement protein A, partial [Candidatus Competibacter sp.]
MAMRPKKFMQGRDIHEQHRVATALELLFDLVFVVSIAAAARELHHALTAHHIAQGLIGFAVAFFGIWWAWMNYTWFASAYDTDDTRYRLTTMAQMFGALILAVGIPDLFNDNTKNTVAVVGYAVMRLAMAAQWLRAGYEDPGHREACYRYAAGILIVQAFWIVRLFLPVNGQLALLAPLIVAELLVPAIAEHKIRTPWHPHHIAERYGLLTIIVLGECILGASNAMANMLQAQGWSFGLFPLGLSITALILALWWLYFDMPWAEVLTRERRHQVAFLFGYGHYLIFASLAAVGAGLEVVADVVQAKREAALLTPGAEVAHAVSPLFAIGAVATTVLVYLFSVAFMRAYVIEHSQRIWGGLLAALGVLAVAVGAVAAGLPLPWALLVTAAAPLMMTLICPNQAADGP